MAAEHSEFSLNKPSCGVKYSSTVIANHIYVATITARFHFRSKSERLGQNQVGDEDGQHMVNSH